MFKNFSSPSSIGLERTHEGIKAAQVSIHKKNAALQSLNFIPADMRYVKRLYMEQHPILVTGFKGRETLVRPLLMPLTKAKDIAAALTFQAEPLLPYPIDQALLTYQIFSKMPESTSLSLLAVRKEDIASHLERWRQLHIEPEKISCVPAALCQFSQFYAPSSNSCLVLHLQEDEMTCVLINHGVLASSFSHTEGLQLLFEVQEKNGMHPFPQTEEGWKALAEQQNPLQIALKRIQRELTKMIYALSKENKGDSIPGMIITGDVMDLPGLSDYLSKQLSFPVIAGSVGDPFSQKDLLSYAVPIGLALGSLPGSHDDIDFCQNEWAYRHPWQRLKTSLAIYFGAILLLCCAFYFFSRQYLSYERDVIRQTYVDLLSDMHKSHNEFEIAFVAKNPNAHEAFGGSVPRIEELDQMALQDRLEFLQKEIEKTPDSFPLFANIPRVSDVLAWLNKHSIGDTTTEDDSAMARLQIENFSYAMLKRPQQGKKQEKYQVKIELEFTSPTPKWAREFHDSLIAPNAWVDPKGEVKWSSNRGKYKTSFFLKDKTVYTGS